MAKNSKLDQKSGDRLERDLVHSFHPELVERLRQEGICLMSSPWGRVRASCCPRLLDRVLQGDTLPPTQDGFVL